MKIAVIGTGYVGLVSGVCLASKGHEVVCVDVIQAKVDRINRADPPIHEEGLEALLKSVVGKGLRASTDLEAAVTSSDVSIIAVGTPFDGQRIDLTYIKEVSASIGRALGKSNAYHVVIVKSTVVPGTTEDVVLPLLEQHSGKKAGADFGVGMNPEFLKEGEAIRDFMEPDRIVLGGIDERSRKVMSDIYSSFEGVDVVHCSPRTAEMIKYTANSLLATLISFSNEIGNLCAAAGKIDATEVMRGVYLDKRFCPILPDKQRVSPSFISYLAAGCGFGGSCFPKDVKALIQYGQDRDQPMQLLKSVVDVNAEQPHRMVEMLEEGLPNLAGKRIALLGLAFKPGTDDVRESPSLIVARELRQRGCEVVAFDPVARHEAEKSLNGVKLEYVDELAQCIRGVDAILIMTSWPQFKAVPEMIASLPTQPLVIDGRRMLAKDSVIRYAGIGLSR